MFERLKMTAHILQVGSTQNMIDFPVLKNVLYKAVCQDFGLLPMCKQMIFFFFFFLLCCIRTHLTHGRLQEEADQ